MTIMYHFRINKEKLRFPSLGKQLMINSSRIPGRRAGSLFMRLALSKRTRNQTFRNIVVVIVCRFEILSS